MSSPTFRHGSVIRGTNIYKDAFNESGCRRFAADTGQSLTSFYSVDTLCHSKKHEDEPRKQNKAKIVRPHSLSAQLKEILWNQPSSSSSELIGGRLDLCMDMPVVIKHNFATELCITNGQEGTVAGWDASIGPDSKLILDTLFVKLKNPPHNIKLDYLPLNTVPISKRRQHTYFHLPSGCSLSIYREQVEVLPMFAMTDYASQGKQGMLILLRQVDLPLINLIILLCLEDPVLLKQRSLEI